MKNKIPLAGIILAAAFTAVYGRRYDKKGFAASVFPSQGLLMAGYVGLYFFRATVPVFLASLVMMCGFLGTGAVIGAHSGSCVKSSGVRKCSGNTACREMRT